MKPWLWLSVATVALWGLWGFLSRVVGNDLTGEEALVLNTVGLSPIIIWLALRPSRKESVNLGSVGWAVLGGLVGNAGNFALYHLMNSGEKAATTIPLTSLYPVLTILLAMVVLRERMSGWQWGGIGASLVAIWCFNMQSAELSGGRWLVFAMLPLACWGFAALFQKMSTRKLSGECSTLWFLLGLVPMAVWMAISPGLREGLNSRAIWLALISGLMLGLGNLTLLAAYSKDGKASVITPLSSIYPMVTVLLAVTFLGERLGSLEKLGISCSLLGVIMLSVERRPSVEARAEGVSERADV
ncbi:MAG: DMT family transporter [Verrucomicrobia bacterium]|nr:DMT family transporter [Verrucomicrobiota bacterium]